MKGREWNYMGSCIHRWRWMGRIARPGQNVKVNLFRLDALALSVIATATWLAGWLAGWLAVTLRYCIKTAKPIGKLFRPSESAIILVFWDPCADTKFQGKPLQGALNTRGVWKFAISFAFRRTSPNNFWRNRAIHFRFGKDIEDGPLLRPDH